MTTSVRRPGRIRRRAAFSLRQTILCFGLVAIVLCGAGLTLRLAIRTADSRPLFAVVIAVVLAGAVAALRNVRGRRRAARVTDAVVEATYEIAGSAPVQEERQGDPAAAVITEAGTADMEVPVETFAATDYAAMDPVEFEQAVAALCERDGCRDVRVVGGAGDLGADVVGTTPDGRRVVIQCKRYGPMNKVGSQDVQRFGGTCFAVHEAHVAAVVTTGEFTQPAAEYAEQCGILCVDHAGLVAWTDGTGFAPWEAEVSAPSGNCP
ncbi:restriction endonuclease [Streptomyces chryseus]|uniref:Restriction endonuclease n=1 Tax=Streptomyces chryseus TaxID=68186 RepID=A0ABQ3DTF3_9ACTN|nr:restriction endonuclease [Streptomyces chryseus]GGX09621.1 restriction endonuclease [Streptomyces chryseus]GHB06129.1 restriction endonuclease [Streptomyces chryseus]